MLAFAFHHLPEDNEGFKTKRADDVGDFTPLTEYDFYRLRAVCIQFQIPLIEVNDSVWLDG